MSARSASASGRSRRSGTLLGPPRASPVQCFETAEHLGGGQARPRIVPGLVDLGLEHLRPLPQAHLMLLQEAQAGPDDLAGVLEAAPRHLLLDELLEIIAKADIGHKTRSTRATLITIDSNLAKKANPLAAARRRGNTHPRIKSFGYNRLGGA